ALLDDGTLQATAAHCQAHGYRDLDGAGQFRKIPDNSYGNAASNVALLFDLYRDESDQQLNVEAISASLRIYLEGIGTSSGQSDSFFGQGTGDGKTGVLARVGESPTEIQKQLLLLLNKNPQLQIKSIEFDIFG